MNSRYDHTQHGRLHFILIGIAILLFAVVAPQAGAKPAVAGGFRLVATLFVALASMFAYLKVTEDEDHILVAFGPLSLFSRKVRFADIKDARATRSKLIDGWGVHWIMGRGWTWNVWGFDCVMIEFHSGRTLRLGTDDSQALAELLRERASSE